MPDDPLLLRNRLGFAGLILLHIIVCCVSLVLLSDYMYRGDFDPQVFHLFYDPARLAGAVAVVAGFALVSPLFIFAGFSFGYFTGFCFYTMVLSYLWINFFSKLSYNHRLAGLSAAASAVAFLLPALFITSPVKQIFALSAGALDRLLTFILLISAAAIAVGAIYNFRFVAFDSIYDFRDKIETPTILNYLIGITSSALLPFAFAIFVARKDRWRAGAVLLLLLFFYPVTLNKIAFFAPLWLVALVLALKFFEARTAVVLSLLGPMLAGIILFILFKKETAMFFVIVNFRMIAIPAAAMDVYNDFFARHDLTYFCQIWFLKPIMNCPYQEPLSIVMRKAYELGNFNASLFATEGIASIGPLLAPVSALLCGLVIALGNRLSAGLPARFIMISGAILPQILLNVPLSTVLVTHGMAILFLLWYITPRTMFELEKKASGKGGN
jgi:hypothetical protein